MFLIYKIPVPHTRECWDDEVSHFRLTGLRLRKQNCIDVWESSGKWQWNIALCNAVDLGWSFHDGVTLVVRNCEKSEEWWLAAWSRNECSCLSDYLSFIWSPPTPPLSPTSTSLLLSLIIDDIYVVRDMSHGRIKVYMLLKIRRGTEWKQPITSCAAL